MCKLRVRETKRCPSFKVAVVNGGGNDEYIFPNTCLDIPIKTSDEMVRPRSKDGLSEPCGSNATEKVHMILVIKVYDT